MLRTAPVCPCMLSRILPAAASQSFSVVSPELEARVFPSGLQATLQIESVWPGKLASSLPVEALPELYRLIVRAGRQGLSIRTPRNAVDIPSVSLQTGPRLALGDIQGLHRLVARAEARIIPSELQFILKTGPLREAALSACCFS